MSSVTAPSGGHLLPPEGYEVYGKCLRGHPKIDLTAKIQSDGRRRCQACDRVLRQARRNDWLDNEERIQAESDETWRKMVYPHPWERDDIAEVICEEYAWLSVQIGSQQAICRLIDVYRVTERAILRVLKREEER